MRFTTGFWSPGGHNPKNEQELEKDWEWQYHRVSKNKNFLSISQIFLHFKVTVNVSIDTRTLRTCIN